tara:strand:+ start:331 stop:522 length:192 start_codon:yes stop_codon:yes gene_type:complete
MLTILKVEGKRYLLNDSSPTIDNQVNDILSYHPKDALVEFVKPELKDVLPLNIKDILNKTCDN